MRCVIGVLLFWVVTLDILLAILEKSPSLILAKHEVPFLLFHREEWE